MQNGHRWVVREKTTGKWVKSVDGIPIIVEYTEDLAEALRYATRFRAEDDANSITWAGRRSHPNSSLVGLLFEVYEFEDSDRSRQVDPHLVFTPKEMPERRKRKP